jgi:hypothetical protein
LANERKHNFSKQNMLAINCKKLIQLPIIFMSFLSLLSLNPKSSIAAPSECKFLEREKYSTQNLIPRVPNRFQQGVLSIADSSDVTSNGTTVRIASGSWRLQSVAKGQPVTVQTAGSMFLMIIDMGEIKRVWSGTCESDGFARGTIYDPSVPSARASFAVRFDSSLHQ